jgi:polyphosphate kinase
MVPTPTAVRPRPVPEGAGLDHPNLYLNRELGWIDFNWRVLSQGWDRRLPLLERVRFLGITASNLDEFVQKRFGGLRRLEAARVVRRYPDGRVPS